MVNTTQQSVTVLSDAHECPVKNSVIATCAYYLLSLHCLPLDKPGLVFSSTHYYAKTVIRFSLSGLVQFNQSKLLQPFLVYYMLPPNDLTFSSWEKSSCTGEDWIYLDAISHIKSHKCQTNGNIHFIQLALDSMAQYTFCLHC